MKKILLSAAIPVLLAPLAFADIKLPRVSPKATVAQAVGLTDVTITYSRPGVKGRAIWGGLVPYDQVWRTGANEATIVTLSQDVKINGKPLPAGTYSLHTIPGKTTWTIIFNKKAERRAPWCPDKPPKKPLRRPPSTKCLCEKAKRAKRGCSSRTCSSMPAASSARAPVTPVTTCSVCRTAARSAGRHQGASPPTALASASRPPRGSRLSMPASR